MATQRARIARVGLVAVAAALGAAGCGSTHPSATGSTTAPTAAPGSTSPGSTAPASTSPASTAPPVTGATTPPTVDGTPATTAPGAPAACTTGQLSAALSAPDGSAGHAGFLLDLTNAGGAACTLEGFPGVSYVTGTSGLQVGAAATENTVARTLVTLAPGQRAQSTVSETDVGVYPPATCRPVAVRGLRVYPPNQRTALYLPQPTQGCANPAIQQIVVGPVEPNGVPTD